QKSMDGRNQLNNYCNKELLTLTQTHYAFPRGKTQYQIQMEIYEGLKNKDAFCISLLNIPEPVDPATVKPIPQTPIDKLNLFQQAVAAKACLGDESNAIFQDVCSEVMQV